MSAPESPGPSPSDPALLERVEELEIRSAFQERALEELDEVVRQFADKVARLERELGALKGRMDSVEALPPTVPPPEED